MPGQNHHIEKWLAKVLADDSEYSPSEKVEILEQLRHQDLKASQLIDLHLLQNHARQQSGLKTANECMEKQQNEIRSLTEPPLYPAIFLKFLGNNRALVLHGGSQRLVVHHPELESSQLGVGDSVLLNSELNVLLELANDVRIEVGEVAEFENVIDSRLVLRCREDRIVVQPASGLDIDDLKEGDQLRFDPKARIAYEKIQQHVSQDYFVNDTPDANFSQVGGNRLPLTILKQYVKRICCAQEVVAKYQLGRQQSILLHGPPGCGKTLMVRVVAAEMARLLDQRFRLAIVKPAAWESPYVGVTQSKIRKFFDALRVEADQGVVLVYFDEIEAVGRIRGGTISQHNDKFLAALLAEIDGFAARGNVAIVSSTNRKDLLDPALLERLSDLELKVPRPTRDDAREIVDVHMPPSLPFSPNGSAANATRTELIEHVVSRLYAPNAGNALNQIKFRDGSSKEVASHELISGRIIEQICRATRQSACDREIAAGQTGICLDDLDVAIDGALERMASTLTPSNARSYLRDLPRDIDIVDVTRLHRQSPAPFQFLSLT